MAVEGPGPAGDHTLLRRVLAAGRRDRRDQTLLDIVQRHKLGEAVGVTSICSAHGRVLEAALLRSLADGGAVLVLHRPTPFPTVAYFDSAHGFRHGPKAVLDDRTLVIAYVSNDSYPRRYDMDIIAELRQTLGPEMEQRRGPSCSLLNPCRL